jgi:hypothetical protein
MADNVFHLPPPPEQPDFLVGPFETWKVCVEGRLIPRLTGFREGDQTFLVVDERFAVAFPHDLARSAAWLIANAMAVSEGYSHLGAEQKGAQPFAPKAMEIPDHGR